MEWFVNRILPTYINVVPVASQYIAINHKDKIITFENIDMINDLLDRRNKNDYEFIDITTLTIEKIIEIEKLFYTCEIYEENIITFYSVRDSIVYIVENYY